MATQTRQTSARDLDAERPVLLQRARVVEHQCVGDHLARAFAQAPSLDNRLCVLKVALSPLELGARALGRAITRKQHLVDDRSLSTLQRSSGAIGKR
jgi:hypothetical protein